jgi:hypothetical protein
VSQKSTLARHASITKMQRLFDQQLFRAVMGSKEVLAHFFAPCPVIICFVATQV